MEMLTDQEFTYNIRDFIVQLVNAHPHLTFSVFILLINEAENKNTYQKLLSKLD